MTTWRIPDPTDRELDRRFLEHFLTPAVAAAIVELPGVVVGEAAAPLGLRVDGWLWRTSQLLRHPTRQSPVASPIEWVDLLPAIRQLVEQQAPVAV